VSCPTCGHTLQRVEQMTFWCPRCGTLSDGVDAAAADPLPPALVRRCREFADRHIPASSGYAELWTRSGIAESIRRPEDR
jgi:uncharacterized Zn finger protein (UPF0148 family)